MKAIPSLGLPILAVALPLVTTASQASTIIAQTSFEEAAFVSGEYTDADTSDHFLVNHAGEPTVVFTPTGGQTELSFTTFFSDVRGSTGLSDGDFMGIKTTSSNLTAAYPDGSQGFRFQDPDGTLTLTLGSVDLAPFAAPKISAWYFLSDDSWESADFARLWVTVDGGTEIDLLNTIGSDIDDLDIEGSWTEVMTDLTGYTTATFQAAFSSDAAVEEMWVDYIQFTNVPEPGRVALIAGGAAAALLRRRRSIA